MYACVCMCVCVRAPARAHDVRLNLARRSQFMQDFKYLLFHHAVTCPSSDALIVTGPPVALFNRNTMFHLIRDPSAGWWHVTPSK